MSAGGKREGAGRKPLTPNVKRSQIHLYVTPETQVRIRKLRTIGVNMNREVDILAERLCDLNGLE